MEPNQRLIPWLIIAALIGGVSGDLLLHTPVWGIGFTVWAMILLGLVLSLERLSGAVPRADMLVPGGLAMLCALCLAWRDTLSLSSANVLAFLLGMGLITFRSRTLSRAPLSVYLQGFLLHTLHAMGGMAVLGAKDLPAWWGGQPSGKLRLVPFIRGSFLALPLLVFFGALLASADASFQFLVEQILRINLPEIVGHLLIAGFICWIVGGVLRGRHLTAEVSPPTGRPQFLRLGSTETTIILGALNVLFGVFVLLQLSYLFGGERAVLGTPSLTYAQYARRGFFELIGVVGFAIPLLLVLDWLKGKEGPRLFRTLGGVTVALLALVAASAIWRLWLYIERFGLTEARLNAAAVLCWFVLLLLWFSATILTGRRERFTYGAVLAGYGILLLLNLSNPGAIVARTNLARSASFDPRYNARLGADAVPELLTGLQALGATERDEVSWELLSRYGRNSTFGRDWNAAAATAHALVAARRTELETYLLPRTPGARPRCSREE